MEKETIKQTPSDESAVLAEAPPRASKKLPAIRTAADERFKKAQPKTNAQHAELFRRLAK